MSEDIEDGRDKSHSFLITLTFCSIHNLFSSMNGGIVICVKDEHPEKTQYPIEVTDDGIVICFNDEHPSKA